MLLLIAAMALGIDEQAVGRFTVSEIRTHIDKVLKSPSSATYKPDTLQAAPPSTVLVTGRYLIKGHVDSDNSFGASIRNDWSAIVSVDGEGKTTLLDAVFIGNGGDVIKVVYQAPAAVRYRKDVYDSVRADAKAMLDRIAEQRKRLAPRKRAQFEKKYLDQFIASESKKYSIKPDVVTDIVGLNDEKK